METTDFFRFLAEQSSQLVTQTLTHVGLTFLSLVLALLIGLPVGMAISRQKRVAALVLGLAGVLQTIPSIALLGFLIPFLGIGVVPALLALFLYALLPIVRNTYVGLSEVSPTLKEAAFGMGMTSRQVLMRLEIPLALPVIFAGIRTATVINVGVATLAAYVAGGGLGEFIFGGIALNNTAMILAGAIPAALLAVGLDGLLARLQRLRGMRLRRASILFLALAPVLSAFYWLPRNDQTRLVAGFAHEFYGRADGYPQLRKTYGLRLTTRLIDQNLMYEAVRHRQVDVISGYSTDGRIQAFGLQVLADDKRAFPPYQAAFVVRQAFLDRHPEVAPLLNRLRGLLTDSVMTALNYRADYHHETPETVAREFLRKTGLDRPRKAGPRTGTLTVGSKIFTEQYILVEIIRRLVEGHTTLEVAAKTGLGGTQICFNALRTGAIDLYPEYTGTGLLVILQPGPAVSDSLRADPAATYRYVSDQFLRQYGLVWLPPLGFNNAYALMMRREQARPLKINTISDLQRYLEK
ncbi:ABC transporter permease/substrate-binding protein [Larkinella soli]|uniref:ABC transporter permease/substrate-binding protein n=1 Tax=Larkinella soli TaxID=1770527 RepID=UPI000FFB0B3B|nr:ABC transporter permease/substrate-binding protein [Larkinella soli]